MTESDGALAAQLATDAGTLLLQVRDRIGFADPRVLKDAGDRQAHEFLDAALRSARPGDAVLSEEGVDDPIRLSAERVWIVDPLDGTREFGERGRVDWAVHVALWERGELTAGAVALPAQHRTFATCAEQSGLAPIPDPIRVVASRSRRPQWVTDVAAELGAEVLALGSAGAKAMAVVRGDAEAYVHAGGQYEWDSAAPVVVARAAGLHTSRVDGSPLVYNQPDPLLPDLVICRPEIATALLAALATAI